MKTTLKANSSFSTRGRLRRTALTCLLASTLAAAFGPAATAAEPAGAAALPPTANAAALAPPDVSTVMYSIYQIDGKGADSYEVANGSIATFWFGHAFELGGTRYYTGFTWDTRERYGKPGEDEVGPGTQVNLAEATYTQTGSSPERPWQFRGMKHSVGEFGAYEKPEDVDTRRKPVDFRTPGGKLLLAVPTEGFDNGISFTGYALLVFNPAGPDEGAGWTYVGSINTGEDNSAACAEGDVMPCVASSGELVFSAHGGSDMPRVTVKRSGTEIAGPDKTRQLGAGDTLTYAYDTATKKYVEK